MLSLDDKQRIIARECIASAAVGVFLLSTSQFAPFITAAKPAVGMLFHATGRCGTAIRREEINRIHIPLVVHIDDGTSVTGNGLLLNFLSREALIGVGLLLCQFASDAGLDFGGKERVVVIVGILLPVNDGILGVRLPLPAGGQGNVGVQLAAKVKFGIAIVPALEGIAQPGGLSRGHSCGIGGNEHRLNVGAAVRIKGDPVALLHLGVQSDIGVLQRDGLHPAGQARIGIPTGDALVRIHGERGIRRNHLAADTFLGGDDHAFLIQEEHISDFLKLCDIGMGNSGHVGLLAGDKLVFALEPAHKLEAFFFGSGRGVDGLAFLNPLGAHDFAVLLELIGINLGVGVNNAHGVGAKVKLVAQSTEAACEHVERVSSLGRRLGSGLGDLGGFLGSFGSGFGGLSGFLGSFGSGFGSLSGFFGSFGSGFGSLSGFFGSFGSLGGFGGFLGGLGGSGSNCDDPLLHMVFQNIGHSDRAFGQTGHLGSSPALPIDLALNSGKIRIVA